MARVARAPDYPWGSRWEELDVELAQMTALGNRHLCPVVRRVRGSGRQPAQRTDDRGHGPPEPERLHPGRGRRTREDLVRDRRPRGARDRARPPRCSSCTRSGARAIAQTEYIAGLMPAAEIRVMPGKAWAVDGTARVDRRDPPVRRRGPAHTALRHASCRPCCSPTSSIPRARQAALGDRAWKDLIEHHHSIVRDALGALAGNRERHGRRRLLRDVRGAGTRHRLRARSDETGAGSRHRDPGGRPHRRVRDRRREAHGTGRFHRCTSRLDGRRLPGDRLADGQGPGGGLRVRLRRRRASTS